MNPFKLTPLVLGLLAAAGERAHAQDASPPPAPAPSPQALDQVVIYGNAVGLRQTRANVKITQADLDYYPPGVSADKVLERVSGIQVGSSNAFGGDGFESTISMRGFGKDSIGFSIDGIPNGRTTLGGGSVPTRFFDSSNLAGVDVSQSAGLIGSPSNQALAGHVNYLTQDPAQRFGLRGELAAGSASFGRGYARIDSGELLPGTTAYLSVSKDQSTVSYVDDPAGRNTRDHTDLKIVTKLGNGSVLKLFSGYNQRKETSGTNIVTLRSFNTNPKVDGYTDTWTRVPATDRNYREFKGNPRTDQLSYLDGAFPLAADFKLTAKAYYHTQEGIGKESARGNAGFPGLDGQITSLYFRANNYKMTRRGLLAEVAGKHSDLIDWKAGAWYERYGRRQMRNFHPVVDETTGPDWDPVYVATSEDKLWNNQVAMGYISNRSSVMDGRLKFDYGVTYLDNQVDYRAPIQDSLPSAAFPAGRFNYVNQASVNSGVLPKLGAVYALRDTTEVFAGYAKNAASVTDATLENGARPTLSTALTVNDMDTADAFDFGLRHKGDNYALGAQAFFVDSKETAAVDIAGTLQTENLAQGRRIKGLELTYSGRFDDWRLYGAYTLQKHEYVLDGADAAGYLPRGFIRNGADLVGIADQNLFAEATWHVNDKVKLAMNARVVSSRAGYYANPRITGSGVDERLPGYGLVGLNASYQFGKNSVGLNIENLGDKAYISGIAPELLSSPSTIGRYFIGAPRTLMLWAKFEL